MVRLFSADTANDVWTQAAEALTTKDVISQPGRGGPTRELLRSVFEISDPTQRWVSSRSPAINPAFAIAEVIWILCGRRDASFLTYFNRSLKKFAGDLPEYPGAYGYRLRYNLGFDQLERAYHALSACRDSRQIVLQIWDGRSDLPRDDGRPQSTDEPCNIVALLKVRNDRLEWTQILRSNDLFLGVPYNFVQFTTLQEILAGWLGVGIGAYVQLSDSLHVYDRDVGAIVKFRRDPAPPRNVDSLLLSKSDSDRVFTELSRVIDRLREDRGTRLLQTSDVGSVDLPPEYRNLLSIVWAEAARRSDLREVAQRAVEACTNPVLTALWGRWASERDSAGSGCGTPV